MKVNSKKGFGYIADPSSLGTIGDDVISQFAQKMNKSGKYASDQDWIDANPEIIYYARQLKAQHDGKHVRKYKTNEQGELVLDSDGKKIPEAYQEYSDMYYLEYALHHVQGNHLRDLNILSSPTLGINALDDPEWSQYSPEEIIQMADNGYVVPDKVLVWAHSMRESDVTAYVILSDESGVDGEAESGVDTDINSLRKQATDYILKVNKEQENIDENSKKIEQKQKEVKKIEKQNKLFRKYSIEKIKSDADELKELEEKAKNGKLDIFEKGKLKKLKRQLSEESSRIKNLQDTEERMNDFLSSIDALQKEANEDIQLAEDTVSAAEELAKLKNEFDENYLTSAASEALANQNKGISDVLSGALTPEIPDIADKVATQLRDTSQEVIASLDSDKTEGYVDFAKNYVEGAGKVQKTLGISEENGVDDAENTDKLDDKNKNIKNGDNEYAEFMSKAFWFVLPFSANPVVAYMMTIATLASMETTKDIRHTVTEENKELQKGLKEYKKASQKLDEETTKAEAQKVANDAKLDELNAKLSTLEEKSISISDEVNESIEETLQHEAPNDKEVDTNGNPQEAQNSNGLDEKVSENDVIISEKELISSQIGEINTDALKTTKKLTEAAEKTSKILKNNSNISKSIRANSAELQKSKDTTKSLSTKSTVGGNFTTAVGIYNLSVAIPLLVQATAMMASVSPVTVSMGITLAAIAKNWIGIGSAQTLTGAGEITSGVFGFEEAGLANIQLAANKEPQTTHEANTKMSREQVKHTNETLESFAASLGIELPQDNGAQMQIPAVSDNTKPEKFGPNNLTKANADKDSTTAPLNNLLMESNSPKNKENGDDNENNELNAVNEYNKDNKDNKLNENNEGNEENLVNDDIQENDTNEESSNTLADRLNNAKNVFEQEPLTDDYDNENNGEQVHYTLKQEEPKENIIKVNDSDVSDNKSNAQNEVSETDLNLKEQKDANYKYKKEQEQNDKIDKEIEEEVEKAVEQEEQQAKIDLEKEKQEEEQKIQENLQTLQAAAATGVNIASALDANDKSEKKLTRFNNDSIIESRKKARRVTAITEAQKKRA